VAIQQQQIQQPQQQQQEWQPQFDKVQTRRLIDAYSDSPSRFQGQDLESIRRHAQYYNVPFYEGDFSIWEAIKQAGGGLVEGFTTLRVADHPDNEYEAIARNLGHLVGFVPGILSGPFKGLAALTGAKSLLKASQAVTGIKSIPMMAADVVTKKAKSIIKPIVAGASGSRFQAANTASKFFLGEKAAHMAEGAFHLGTASAVSSIWDGVDQMMHSFMGGAVAGGVFRGLGNIWPGEKGGDKLVRQLAGGMFMGLPETMRGATTPEQIYQYLIGAYFGGKESPWFRAKAIKVMKEFDKQAEKDPMLEWSKDVEKMEGWEDHPEIVRNEVKKIIDMRFIGDPEGRLALGYELMEEFGITDKIPAEELDTRGFDLLNRYVKGRQIQTKHKAVDKLGVAVSGAAPGSDAYWSIQANKKGLITVHMIPEAKDDPGPMKRYYNLRDKGQIRGFERGLRDADLMEGGPAVEKANQTLKRPIEKYSPRQYQYVLRGWHQIKGAGSIFAIGEITTKGPNAGRTVKGGTGWAVQMGLDKGLSSVFVYDPVQKSWFQWASSKNRFQAIHGTPKLRKNPALIGTRGDIKYKTKDGQTVQRLSDHAKQAIKDVMEITFGPTDPVKPSPVTGAVPIGQVKEHHKETIKNINNLKAEIDAKKQDIRDINKAIKDGVDKPREKELIKQRKELQKSIDKMYKEIVDKHDILGPQQFYDPITGKLEEDVDIGMGGSDFALMKKSEYFANKYLEPLWNKEEGLFSKRDRMIELGKEAETLLRNHIEKGNKDIRINELVKDMEDAFSTKGKPFKLTDNGKAHLRKWLRELNLGEQVIFVKTRGGKIIEFTDPSRPTTASGQAKRQIEPPKLVEEIYSIEGGEGKKGVPAPVVIFDSVSRTKKNGLSVDVPLDKLVNHFRFTENMSEKEAIKKFNNLLGNTINDLIKNHNLYPIGGQGDKGRIIFVKLHPKSRKSSEYRKQYIELIRALKKRKIDNKHTDIDAFSQLKKDMKRMKRDYNVSNDDFKKMVASNLMYELSLNGYKYTPENINKIMGSGFIPSAIGFNKRNQIWMTNGYSGSRSFFSNKDSEGYIDDLSPNGNFYYRLIEDPKTPASLKKKALLALSTELPEHVDGAILGRSDWVAGINKDAGHPISGQNKSFIVDNTPGEKGKNMGALLGKYMIHDAGEAASKAMKKEGIHFMMMTSAAKQTGERLVGKYDVKADDSLTLTGGKTYELNPESIKYASSVINDHHMIQRQIWVKQLFTNLHQFGHSPISKDIIQDINKEVIEKSFDGNPDVNRQLDSYIKTLNPSKIDYLLKNLEDIGTIELIDALKTPGAEVFAERVMQEMLRIVEKDIQSQFMEGEISSEERFKALDTLSEAVSPIDRFLKNVSIVGEEAAAQGKGGFSGYLHKFVRDYRASVLHNYFVKSVTRPKTDNSAVARIRPYDKWMQKDFKELNTNDKIFYLDNAYKDTNIKLSNGESKTLGELWKLRNEKAYKNEVKDVFNALVLRVPMDSISGAHKLEFRGFTGREGHGIMMHSRTMRALGGADLDGDEAFVYFGGKKEDGTGFGMKQSWINAIDANKSEFYNKNKTNVTDNKDAKITTGPYKGKTFRELLTVEAEPDHPLKTRKSLYFSPYSRIQASQGASQGRGMLGMAVSQGQTMKAAYNSIMDADTKSDVFDFYIKGKEGGWYRATVTPKEGKEDQKHQRELTRAQIAFASDPLDEAGLKGPEVFFNTLYDAYFNVSFQKKNPKTKRYVKSNAPKNLKPNHLKGGLLGRLQNINRAYFGRNYAEGRNHTMDEVNHMASDIRFFTENQKNTMLLKMAEKLEGLDWSDNLFHRVDRNAVEGLYREIEDMVSDPSGKFGKWLKKALGRSSFRVVYNDHIDAVVRHELHDRNVRHNIANDETPEGLEHFKRVTKHSIFGQEFQIGRDKLRKLYDYNEKIRALEQMHRQAEDFLSNDMATMSTLLNIKRILENNRISPKKIEEISKTVNNFKKKSYLQRDERRELDFNAYLESPKELEQRKEIDDFLEDLYKKKGIKIKKSDLAGDTRSASWDQMKLDSEIRNYKKGLKDGEKELFDHLFLGTLQRGNLNKIKKYTDMLPQKKNSPVLRDLVWRLIQDASKTNQSRLGINSEAISDVSIQNHLREMNNLHSRSWEPTSEKEGNEILKNADKEIEKVKPSEPEIVDEMVQGAHKGSGYAGIKEGEVTKEDKQLITDIAILLKHYNKKLGNNIPDLNEQIRGITGKIDPDSRGKDLNTLNREDFHNIRRFLEDVNDGTFWQKIWETSKPEIQSRYYSLFPETIDRELMKHDIIWLKQEGLIITRGGEVTTATIRKPTQFIGILQKIITENNGMATGKAETLAKEIRADFNHLEELKEGNGLFKTAVAQMETGVKNDIDNLQEPESIKKHFRLIYDQLRVDTEKEFNWAKLKDREFTVLNDFTDPGSSLNTATKLDLPCIP